MAARTSITVTVSLAQRDQAGLTTFLSEVANPASAQYKHYLTVKQFAGRFGATPATVASVRSYLAAHGLKAGEVTANGLTLSATGSAAQVESAFGTTLNSYRDQSGREFYANATAPVLPEAIASVVTDVSGLSNYAVSHQDAVRGNAASKASAGYTPTQIRSAYNLNSAISAGYTGKGQTVALEEFSAFTQSDITTYDKKYSLTPPPRWWSSPTAAPPTPPVRTRSSWTSRWSRRSLPAPPSTSTRRPTATPARPPSTPSWSAPTCRSSPPAGARTRPRRPRPTGSR
ncbi:hypothetical protein GXW82_05520 [Streptacidiphilus sp. 4-A2]|nr:hypothetical protein [Streptacidiphilus sp. 4-A2]